MDFDSAGDFSKTNLSNDLEKRIEERRKEKTVRLPHIPILWFFLDSKRRSRAIWENREELFT